jgi:hypothetical protein
LAGILNITEELLNRTVDKCISSKRIILDRNGLLYIVNWNKYQSESDRVKASRQAKQEQEKVEAKKSPLQISEEYLKGLKTEFSDLDIDEEWRNCQLWWDGKVMKRPKLALRNWLNIAKRRKQELTPQDDGKWRMR